MYFKSNKNHISWAVGNQSCCFEGCHNISSITKNARKYKQIEHLYLLSTSRFNRCPKGNYTIPVSIQR